MAGDYREFAPDPRLARFVDRFWLRRALEPSPACILPDGCMDVLINAAHPHRAVVIGTMTRAETFEPRGSLDLLGVRFRPGAAAAFLDTRADLLTDDTVGCEELQASWLHAARLVEASEPLTRVGRFERMLLSRLATLTPADPKIDYAVASLARSSPPSIVELAADIGWSRQQLSRAFRHWVGVSPKHFARTARLHRAIDQLQRDKNVNLAAVALELGYFDQAHMHRDFRQLAGVTPAVAAASPDSIFPIRSLFAT